MLSCFFVRFVPFVGVDTYALCFLFRSHKDGSLHAREEDEEHQRSEATRASATSRRPTTRGSTRRRRAPVEAPAAEQMRESDRAHPSGVPGARRVHGQLLREYQREGRTFPGKFTVKRKLHVSQYHGLVYLFFKGSTMYIYIIIRIDIATHNYTAWSTSPAYIDGRKCENSPICTTANCYIHMQAFHAVWYATIVSECCVCITYKFTIFLRVNILSTCMD